MSEHDWAWNDTMAGSLVGPGWMPIETAPRDGTQVLTWGCQHDDGDFDMGETPFIAISVYGSYGWFSNDVGGHQPDMWMPLPPPPKAAP